MGDRVRWWAWYAAVAAAGVGTILVCLSIGMGHGYALDLTAVVFLLGSTCLMLAAPRRNGLVTMSLVCLTGLPVIAAGGCAINEHSGRFSFNPGVAIGLLAFLLGAAQIWRIRLATDD